MIYNQINDDIAEQIDAYNNKLAMADGRIARLTDLMKSTDSKSEEARCKEALQQERTEKRRLSNELEHIRTESFKNLLAMEYGIKRDHPKFDKVFSLAWSHGHSSGYSEVEIYFSEIVEVAL